MFRLAVATILLAVPAASFAQRTAPARTSAVEADEAQTGQPPKRVRSVPIKPGQKCPPQTSSDEVVVCYTEDQPYRIPKELRNSGPIPAQNQSWTNRAANADQVSRVAGGLPDTCSAVGTGGQSGCQMQINQQWAAEERARRAAEANPTAPAP